MRPQATTPTGLPPQLLQMWDLMYGLIRTQVLYVVAMLGIADLLHNEPLNAEALAAATGCHAPSLSRVLRVAVTTNLLSVDEERRYHLTPLGEMLRRDSPLPTRAGGVFYGAPFVWAAWGNLLETVRTGKTAFEVVHGSPIFDYLASHRDELRIFTDFMSEMARPRLGSAVIDYDFPASGLVVDVGGGDGTMLLALLDAHPSLRGLLFDRPEVIARFSSTADAAERCSVQGGDFLESVPVGGDVYILSNILHDWDDEHADRILRNCRAAMRRDSRLLVIDAVVPDREVPFGLAALDLQMLVLLGGKQRTLSEFRELLQSSGFVLTEKKSSAFIEAEPG